MGVINQLRNSELGPHLVLRNSHDIAIHWPLGPPADPCPLNAGAALEDVAAGATKVVTAAPTVATTPTADIFDMEGIADGGCGRRGDGVFLGRQLSRKMPSDGDLCMDFCMGMIYWGVVLVHV